MSLRPLFFKIAQAAVAHGMLKVHDGLEQVGVKIWIALPRFSVILLSLMNLKPASRIAIRAVVKTVRALWHA